VHPRSKSSGYCTPIKEVAEEELGRTLSGKRIQAVLDMVLGDEMLAKDIRTAIVGAVRDL